MTKTKLKIKIDRERCKGCELCLAVCPHMAISISDDVNKKGLRYIVLSQAEKCTGCGLCLRVCPDCAIELEEVKE